MGYVLYKVVSLLGESEERSSTPMGAALEHVAARKPHGQTTVTVHRNGVTLAFKVDPRIYYEATPDELPPCFEARQ